MRNLCLDSCSLNRAALTKGTDWSGKPPPDSMPAVMRAVSRSVYVLLITSAWLWSIVTFWYVSRRKPRRRPRTLGRALAAPLNWTVQQHTTSIDYTLQLQQVHTVSTSVVTIALEPVSIDYDRSFEKNRDVDSMLHGHVDW